ncbi:MULTISPECIES: hypothetical protein [unclassified Curtobacterium]|uniref:hypothetical protein n=1 Tax=unclassified Curtobacterium TaxID=257496 RepID=UPI0038270D6D
MIIFLLVGLLAVPFGVFLMIFRKAAADFTERGRILPERVRPKPPAWFIAVIGGGMVVIGLYFVIASSVGIATR